MKVSKKIISTALLTILVSSQVANTLPLSVSADSKLVNETHSVNHELKKKSADVSTFEEFKQALEDVSVTYINVTKNIEFDSNITMPKRDVTINATQGISINTGTKHIIGGKGTDVRTTLTITNANIVGADKDASKFFDEGGANRLWDVYAKDVNYTGSRFVTISNGTLTFDGENQVSTLAENAYVRHVVFKSGSKYSGVSSKKHNYSAFYFNGSKVAGEKAGHVTIEENADVTIEVSPDNDKFTAYPAFFDRVYAIDVKENAKLNIDAAGPAVSHVGSGYEENPQLNILDGAEVDLESRSGKKPTVEFGKEGEINVSPNASLNIIGGSHSLTKTSKESVIKMSKRTAINIDSPKNFSIENKAPNSPLFNDKDTVLNIKDADINVWSQTGGDYEREPDSSWNAQYMEASISGAGTTNVTSDNSLLEQQFSLEQYGKLSVVSQGKEMKETTINPLTTDSTEVKGTGEPGASVEIKVGDQVIGSGTIQEDGTYNIVIPAQKEGTTVEAIATFEGQTSAATTIVQASEKDYSITANDFTIGSTYVTGSVGKDVATVNIYVNGKVINKVNATDGKFRAYVSVIHSVSDIVKVVSVDEAGIEKEEAKVNVIEQDLVLTANEYTIGDEYITGKYDKTATKVVLYIDGEPIKMGSLDSATMTYEVAANKLVTSTDQKVEIVMSKGTTELKRVTVKVNEAPVPEYTLTADEYTMGEEYITGNYDKEATKVVLYIDGESIKMGSLDPATMTYKVAANKLITSTDQKVEIVMSKGTTELKRVTVKVNEAPVPEYTLTADEYTIGEEYITGNYDKEATKVVLYIDGKDIKKGSLDPATMTYKVAANKLVTSADQKVEIVMSKGTTELKRVTVKVNEALVPDIH
ncbi:hypothetical protein HB848_13620 [Listeria rocourtiae]|uniref:immunoglobulin-like domain-containing protein n=1 Tax=Listeria rocourtiae TaxID=647910 RepID=UPI0016291E56|nr:immunoglobulin-like domain-containing protein [Listeria rocourtiae]MBC1436377.1 hypothetical protein [Listeria rocourtiae]